MTIIEEKYKCVLDLIKTKLFGVGKDRKVYFRLDDFDNCKITRESCYNFLKRAEKDGFVNSVKITDSDKYGEDSKSGFLSYHDYPELCSGIFEIVVSKNFSKLLKSSKQKGGAGGEGETNNKFLIEFIGNQGKAGNSCRLGIEGFEPIQFHDFRCALIGFFYNADDRKNWKSYDDIKSEIADHDTESIRKSIDKINQRVSKLTKNKITTIIESKEKRQVFNSPRQYRWKF